MVAPKLRFKEFDGYWNKNTIGNFVLNYKGGASLTPADFVDYSECEVIPKKAISSGGALQLDKDVPTFCTPEFFNLNQNYVVDSEYLITTLRDLVPSGPSIGYIVKYEGDKQYILAQGVYGFRIKNDLCRDFLIQFSNTSKFRLHMQSIMVGSTQVHIRNHDYFSTELYTPSLLEQTQIASFLSTVDEKISQLSQKLHLLGQYKQGMMQKLFSQQLRFKANDGSEFAEWKKTEIKNISKIFDGTHQTPNYVTAGVPFYSVEHVTANNFKNTKYIAEDVYLAELKRVQLEKGDILLTRIGDIGTCRLIDWDVRASFYVSLALIKVNKQHNSSFVNQYIKSNLFQKELHERTIHVAFPKKINLGEIGLCLIQLPCLEEQTKIANFLSTIDQKMDVVSEQLEQAKLWKKGLLQQMFV